METFASDVHDVYSNMLSQDLEIGQKIRLSVNQDLKAIVNDPIIAQIPSGTVIKLPGSCEVRLEKRDSHDSGKRFSFQFSEMRSQPLYDLHKSRQEREIGRDGSHRDRPSASRVQTGSIAVSRFNRQNPRLEIGEQSSKDFSSRTRSFELVS